MQRQDKEKEIVKEKVKEELKENFRTNYPHDEYLYPEMTIIGEKANDLVNKFFELPESEESSCSISPSQFEDNFHYECRYAKKDFSAESPYGASGFISKIIPYPRCTQTLVFINGSVSELLVHCKKSTSLQNNIDVEEMYSIKNGNYHGLYVRKEVPPEEPENSQTEIGYIFNDRNEGSFFFDDNKETINGNYHAGLKDGLWTYHNKSTGEIFTRYFIADKEYTRQDYNRILRETRKHLAEDTRKLVFEYMS